MMEDWKTVITFTQPHEAYIAKGLLESEGVETIVKDEFTAQVNNFYSNAIGGVKIQIKESDYERGLSILQEGGFIRERGTAAIQDFEIVPLNHQTNKDICPFCKSDNIGRKKAVNMLAVMLYFILGALFPIFKRSYICYNCEKEWKYKKLQS